MAKKKRPFDDAMAQALADLLALDGSAAELGAPPALARHEAVSALLLQKERLDTLAGGPREWGLALSSEGAQAGQVLNVERWGPGGHGGGEGLLATLGRPGSQLTRGLGAARAGRRVGVIVGSRSVADKAGLLHGLSDLSVLVLAVNEGREGEPPQGCVVKMAKAAGWTTRNSKGSGPELARVLADLLPKRDGSWPKSILVEWTGGSK